MRSLQFIFSYRPHGLPGEDVFRLEESDPGGLNDGELLLKPLYISVDPYMRGRMNDTKSYAKSWIPGQIAEGSAVARVIKSKSSSFKEGDLITGILPWSTCFRKNSSDVRKIDSDKYPPEYYLGILGMPGLTAYFGIIDICKPVSGDTVVVSGAAGAVGHVAGQIAKIQGGRVVGIAGSDDKCRILKEEFGFDETINYRATRTIRKEIAKLCPEGVNAYFDNVGGEITEGVIANLAFHSRVAVCGQISQYNATRLPSGNFMMSTFLTRSVLLKGFIVSDYRSRFNEAFESLKGWLNEGRLKYKVTVIDGFEKLPETFLGLFSGLNTGKLLVRVND